MVVPLQYPPAHTSLVVQAEPSSQLAVLFACVQPLTASQASSVHGLPSSQLTLVPLQAPAAQTSLAVQTEPSLQLALLFAWVQPLAVLQASFVQTLPSSQLMVVPRQTPLEQTSLAVQAELSLQLVPFVAFAWVQPLVTLHASVVQALLSLQLIVVPRQTPLEQASLEVQAELSLQLVPFVTFA
jgi:hypothetical protein